MWVVHLMLTLAAVYAVIIAGMYFAQTWLLFPTMLARGSRVQLPASTHRLEVRTPEGERLTGVQIPSQGATADGAQTLLGFGGNAWNAEATALTLHALFPHRDVAAFHYRGYAPSTGTPSARALFSRIAAGAAARGRFRSPVLSRVGCRSAGTFGGGRQTGPNVPIYDLRMCGRVIQSSGPLRYAIVDGLDVRDSRLSNYPRRWKGAPSQELVVIRENHMTGERSLDLLRWGP